MTMKIEETFPFCIVSVYREEGQTWRVIESMLLLPHLKEYFLKRSGMVEVGFVEGVEVCCWLFPRRGNGWSWVVEEEVELNSFFQERM
jgi:hypothetical protein